MKIKLPLQKIRRSGFSLAEVTIATGITALALSTLLGIIPEGLKNIRDAGGLAAETRITSHLLGVVSQAEWETHTGEDLLSSSFHEKRYFFDDQGIAIEGGDPGLDLAYVAEVKIPRSDVNLSADVTAAEDDAIDPYLRRVTVKVANTGSKNFNFDRVLPMAYRQHTTLIARTGK
ncbi:Verru_Chthon cassette protein B [Prosthecobacter debontii]|uniref:Verru_Chthon cassette protein B n=1 Tax=Prosthecobacter debontii TaxID=48467 RepID=A0A1T4XMZ6_9BACT|nr:Verru_Chthon cassette protein B [Prosthecobacter debontii]SKA90465.1 Verru_Chthon cassette protein B [Prosthecobacter debontii]